MSKEMWAGPVFCTQSNVLELVSLHGMGRRYTAGDVILAPGDALHYVFYIVKGVTTHHMVSTSGKQKLMYRLGPGWFFSEGIFSGNSGEATSLRYATVEEDTYLYLLDANAFDELAKNRVFVDAILRSAVEKCNMLRSEIESIAFESTISRFKRLLLTCMQKDVFVDGKWHPLTVSWTHQDMAAILGTNRVTVSRFISELRNDHFLRIINGDIQINAEHTAHEGL